MSAGWDMTLKSDILTAEYQRTSEMKSSGGEKREDRERAREREREERDREALPLAEKMRERERERECV